jgi:hypothetical protein
MSANLEPDDAVIYQFLSEWFAGCNRGLVELAWTDRAGKLQLFRRFALDDLAAATWFAAETNTVPGASFYFRPATVTSGQKYTTDQHIVQIPGCWADCDTEDAIARVLAADTPPTFQVVTGRFPSLRGQFLWQLASDPITVGDWSRVLNRQALALAGSDAAVTNPSSLLRLPGSIAWPLKPGRIPELTEWIRPNGRGSVFSLASLQSGLPPPAEPAAAARGNGATTASELLNPIRALIDQARAGKGWHNSVRDLVAMLVSRNTPRAAILAMAEHLTLPDYKVAQTREELGVFIDGAVRKGFGEVDIDDVLDVEAKAGADIPVLSVRELRALPAPAWMIDGVLPLGTFSVVYGSFSTFKSFLALDMALSLATGTPWCGRAVKQTDVLYIAGEGVFGFMLRIDAWAQHHKVADELPSFRMVPLAINLMDRAHTQRLIDIITPLDGFNPKLVVVDTLHRSMVGADENSAKDAGLAVSNAALIQQAFGCTVLAIHHAGKNEDRGLRGSTGLPGAADTIIRVNRSDEDRLTLMVEKQKDGEQEQEFNLRAQSVTLGATNGSELRSSLVLVPDDNPAPKAKRHLTPTEHRARRYLVDLIASEGKPLPQGGDWPTPSVSKPILGVPTERWRQECAARHLSAADDKRNRNATFRRVFQALLDKAAVIVRDDTVWLP